MTTILHRTGTSTRLFIGISSCIVIISLVAYTVNTCKGKAGNESEKNSRAIENSSSNDQEEVNNKRGENDSPMFEYSNQKLTKAVLEMASQRATRWMSFRVSDVHNMVGQVGGKSHQKRPILIYENFVMKPPNLDHRGVREIAFYEAIQATHARNKRGGYHTYRSFFGSPRDNNASLSYPEPFCDKTKVENETKLLHRLELFTPKYFGTVKHDDGSSSSVVEAGPFGIDSKTYILLNNLTSHFSKPCVLDLKIGTHTYEPDAPEEKKMREITKYPQQVQFGFRMVAMRIYEPSNVKADEEGYVYYPKQFGQSLDTRESVKDALRTFLGGDSPPEAIKAMRSNAIKRILRKIKLIRGWFRDNDFLVFHASSILIIYEGETKENTEEGVELDMARVKMIDFGRVRRQPGGDDGYRKGLCTLIGLLEEILKESFWSDNYEYLE